MEKKQQVRAIFQVGAWLAFIMLGYLGIRSYKLSVEKLKTNKCIEEIETLSRGIQFCFQAYPEGYVQRGLYGSDQCVHGRGGLLLFVPDSRRQKQGF